MNDHLNLDADVTLNINGELKAVKLGDLIRDAQKYEAAHAKFREIDETVRRKFDEAVLRHQLFISERCHWLNVSDAIRATDKAVSFIMTGEVEP
jgi:hypothetical protein